MADYYSLLSRAIANLPKSSTPTARKAIYDRARKALNNQLRSLKPPLPESDIVREETALDEAVLRIEAAFDAGAAPSPPVASLSRAPPAAKPGPAAPPNRPPAPAPARPVLPRPAAPSAATRAPPPPVAAAHSPDVAEETFAPPVAAPPSPARPGLSRTDQNAPRVDAQAAPPEAAQAPSVAAPPQNETEPGRSALLMKPAAQLAASREAEPPRPFAPRAEEASRGGAWKWAALAVALGLIGAVAVEAFLLRSQNSQDLGVREPTPAAVASIQPMPAGPKIVERVGGGEAPTPDPGTAVSLAPTAAPSAVAPATPELTPPPTPTATPAAALPAATGADRAAFLLALPQEVQKPTVSLGNVVWSSPPANPGQGGGPGVRADVDIPDFKMRATMLIRKNTDPSLPASHTIDLRLAFDDGAPFKGVKDVGVPQMRREDAPAPTSLLGVRVVINDTYFLIGLNRADADVQRNLEAIASSNWFDFPMLLADGRIAKLTFEKGSDGDKIVASALAAWK